MTIFERLKKLLHIPTAQERDDTEAHRGMQHVDTCFAKIMMQDKPSDEVYDELNAAAREMWSQCCPSFDNSPFDKGMQNRLNALGHNPPDYPEHRTSLTETLELISMCMPRTNTATRNPFSNKRERTLEAFLKDRGIL